MKKFAVFLLAAIVASAILLVGSQELRDDVLAIITGSADPPRMREFATVLSGHQATEYVPAKD
jgi:hypothetical protein